VAPPLNRPCLLRAPDLSILRPAIWDCVSKSKGEACGTERVALSFPGRKVLPSDWTRDRCLLGFVVDHIVALKCGGSDVPGSTFNSNR